MIAVFLCRAQRNGVFMPDLGHTHHVLFVKLDGIGDYIFFRLFWPQIAAVAWQRNWKVSVLCSTSFLPVLEKYDSCYMDGFFTLPDVLKRKKSAFLCFLPRYYQRLRRGRKGQDIWKKNWAYVYNLQPGREVIVENVMARVHSLHKISNKGINRLLAPTDFYQDDIYTRLVAVPMNKFVLSFFRELL